MINKIIQNVYKDIVKCKEKYVKYSRKKNWINQCKKNTKNIKRINNKQIKEINYFYKPYTKVNTIFHDFYYQKNEKFSKKYIPDDIYYTIIDPFYNNWDEAEYIDNKCYYDRIFPNTEQPKTIVKRLNNIWYDDDNNIIDFKKAKEILKNRESYFMKKATESEGGHGVYYLTNISEFEDTIAQIENDCIIQVPLKQSEILCKLNPSSVNTIRVLTLLSENGVKIYSTIIRMGINGAKVDNASSGGITCGIDKEGRLKEVAYASNGDKYYYHPTTKIKFNSIVIPNYDLILEKIKKLATTIPHFRLVSWDIALNEKNEPVLIEANLRYGELDFHQLNNGPVFGEDTVKILNEVYEK